ncbi:MAG: elongation factor Ts, partial [Candidatus Wildermuthbacteria bacterium RIFCSPLOWO2_02_FULL_47_10]
CQKALEATGGDPEKARDFLRQRGQKIAELKSARTATQGIVAAYVHSNKKVGVLLDLRCESDFVARSPEFSQLAHEITLQIAAMNPKYAKADEIPAELIAEEKRLCEEQLADSGKPQNIISQIVEGRLSKYRETVCLLSQQWIKDEGKTMQDFINEHIAIIGENIVVGNFIRYEI